MIQFHVGQKVVCVDDSMRVSWRKIGWFSKWRRWQRLGHNLNRGDIYTVAAVGLLRDSQTAKEVVCISVREAWHFDKAQIGFPAFQFRPVKTTSIDVFEKMLAPTPRVKEPTA